MPVAVLSDIHGNRWALEAVLEDLERRAVTEAVNLGDSFYGPLDPAGCFALLAKHRWPTVRGNQDRVLLEGVAERTPDTCRFTREAIGEAGRRWIAGETESTVLAGDLLLCHGTPQRDDRYLFERLTQGGVELRSPAQLDLLLGEARSPVVLCGHSHVPRMTRTAAGRLLVNPGSVGLPAYRDEDPVPHVMESGSPLARYALLSLDGATWSVELIGVRYDHEAASRTARLHGRLDWSRWLRTGRA